LPKIEKNKKKNKKSILSFLYHFYSTMTPAETFEKGVEYRLAGNASFKEQNWKLGKFQ
jgi:hypothetical protein